MPTTSFAHGTPARAQTALWSIPLLAGPGWRLRMWSPAASATRTARSPLPRVGARQREGAAFWLSGVGSSGGLVGGAISTVTSHDARALWRRNDPRQQRHGIQRLAVLLQDLAGSWSLLFAS